MEYEEAFFPSADGIPLEAWFIPANSDKLLIINHPMTCNRYGFPGHLPPWNTMFGGFEVNFLPELKHLHDAGYNILTYDLRNCGLSGEANGNTSGLGLLECRDVLGSVRYAKGRKDLSSMTTGLYSRCMGGNSTIIAMAKWPKEFTHIKALVLLNVVSGKTFIERGAENLHLDPKKAAERLDERLRELTASASRRRRRCPTRSTSKCRRSWRNSAGIFSSMARVMGKRSSTHWARRRRSYCGSKNRINASTPTTILVSILSG
jgi:hypothetical protein